MLLASSAINFDFLLCVQCWPESNELRSPQPVGPASVWRRAYNLVQINERSFLLTITHNNDNNKETSSSTVEGEGCVFARVPAGLIFAHGRHHSASILLIFISAHSYQGKLAVVVSVLRTCSTVVSSDQIFSYSSSFRLRSVITSHCSLPSAAPLARQMCVSSLL